MRAEKTPKTTSENAFLGITLLFIGIILAGFCMGIEARNPHAGAVSATEKTSMPSKYENYGTQHMERAELNSLREML